MRGEVDNTLAALIYFGAHNETGVFRELVHIVVVAPRRVGYPVEVLEELDNVLVERELWCLEGVRVRHFP